MIKVIKHKIPQSREEWKADRLKGIGGSDVGALLGLNPYKSPYALWCEKTGKIVNDFDNEAMRQGRDLEDYVAQRFTEETGKKVKKSSFSFQSVEHPYMLANVDRLVVGEASGLECKTASALTRTKYDKGDIPISYYCQCMHYMAVTGLKKWYIAVLVLGKSFHVFEINRDEDEIASLIEREGEFWENVVNGQEPSIDGLESTAEALSVRYAKSTDSYADLTGNYSTVEIYSALKKKKKELDEEIKLCENIIKNEMAEHETALINRYAITWKPQVSQRVDSTKLKKEYPDIYKQCLKNIETRVFKVKEIEQDGN